MTIETLISNLPETAKDIRLNLMNVLSDEGTPELNVKQRYGIALSSAYATKQTDAIQAIHQSAAEFLSENELTAAQAAANIMAMNNIYYRFVHLADDQEYSLMPAKLRMNILAKPGIEKIDFELNSLAISIINGCGMCINAHMKAILKEGASKQAIQATARISAVIHAAAQAIATN